MTLKEVVHQSIDELDNDALAIVYEQIKRIQTARLETSEPKRVPTIEEVWELTSADKSSWSDAVTEDREDRL